MAMFKATLTLFLLFISIFSFSQSKRNIPYPILFVHGWTGSDATWYAELVHLRNTCELNVDIDHARGGAGLGSRIDFNLNADNNAGASILRRNDPLNYGDVRDHQSFINPENDVFVINFDNGSLSNQSGIVKQGFAVGLAVKKILIATGAEKIVLFGHSMGGLAIREYLQNQENWLFRSWDHCVAKLITSGTPHLGSNVTSLNLLALWGKDENSEAVRDMRTNISGNYLYGGYEGTIPTRFANKDINSNGVETDFVAGLNLRPVSLNLEFVSIIGTGGKLAPLTGSGDDIVSTTSANFFNINYDIKPKGESFQVDNNQQQSGTEWESTWHVKLPKQTFINQYALDEPGDVDLAYEIYPDRTYKAFLTPHSNSIIYDYDFDRYKIDLPSRGVLTLQKNIPGPVELLGVKEQSIYFDQNKQSAYIPYGGFYYLGISGETGKSSGAPFHFVKYNFSTSFCRLPNLPELANKDSVFCDGNTVKLNLKNEGYDSYKWFRDDVLIGTGNTLIADKEGTYSVSGLKCGVEEKSTSNLVLTKKPAPTKPVITLQNSGLNSSATIGNQWFIDDLPLLGETNQTVSSIKSGVYKVRVSINGCTALSDPFVITGIEKSSVSTFIYPNPSNGNFFVNTDIAGNFELTILDQSGKELTKVENVSRNAEIKTNLGNGIYLIKIKSRLKQLVGLLSVQK